MRYRNILQIDDDDDDCEFFHDALLCISTANYTSLHNPVDALNQLTAKQINPDIIFLDLNMPIMTGFELLSEFKKRDIIQNVPVIVFSTTEAIQDKKKAAILGAADFFTKPTSLTDLKNLLQRVI
ncbi:response regulator [Flavobacterium sp.]|uniref:response regulator n=1 Tax=Flavobacterium sp. TaxID=239 RepID=UPI00374DB3A6